MPKDQQVVIDKRGQQFDVTVELRQQGGRLEPVAISVRSETPLTREVMKQMPFGAIFGSARRAHVPARTKAGSAAGAQRGVALGDGLLREVAVAYRSAFMAGEPVVQAVAASGGVSRSAAAKRIRAARDAGLL